jgi:hypothetical protein
MTTSDQPTHIPCPNCGFAIPIGTTWCEGCGAGNRPIDPSRPAQKNSRSTLFLLTLTLFVIPMIACGSCSQDHRFADWSVITVFASTLVGFGLLIVHKQNETRRISPDSKELIKLPYHTGLVLIAFCSFVVFGCVIPYVLDLELMVISFFSACFGFLSLILACAMLFINAERKP